MGLLWLYALVVRSGFTLYSTSRLNVLISRKFDRLALDSKVANNSRPFNSTGIRSGKNLTKFKTLKCCRIETFTKAYCNIRIADPRFLTEVIALNYPQKYAFINLETPQILIDFILQLI